MSSGNVEQCPRIFRLLLKKRQKIRGNTVQAGSGDTVKLSQSCNFLAGNSSSESGGSAKGGGIPGLEWLTDAPFGGGGRAVALPGLERLDALTSEEQMIAAAACVAIGLIVAFS